MEFSIVIPMRNEAQNVAALLADIDQALQGRYRFEVICVDDGSDDGTGSELAAARRRYGWLRVLRHAQSRGQSTALVSGALAAGGAWIATLDGDGQNDPADIPHLLDARGDRETVMVCGIRARRNDSFVRRVSSRVANQVRGRILGDGVSDTGCGLKLMPRALLLAMPRFNHMHRFLPALAHALSAPIACVDVNHRPRVRGVSKYGVHNRLWVGIVDLFGVLWLRRRIMRAGAEEADSA